MEILDEVDIWLDESREDTFCAELFEFSFRAAELAAILGFTQPPFEHVIEVPYAAYAATKDTLQRAHMTTVCFNSPLGIGGRTLGFPPPLTGALLLSCSARLHADLKALVRPWLRAVARVDVENARPAPVAYVHYLNSLEAGTFDEQRLRELVGDQTSVWDEAHEQVSEAFRVAELEGLTPEQRMALVAERARASSDRACQRRKELAAQAGKIEVQALASACAAVPNSEALRPRESREALRRRAEAHIKEVCGGSYPGFRKLARALGCSLRPASLKNAIKASKYLSAREREYEARKERKATEQALTEVHLDCIAQSTEEDPAVTVEELVRDQAADERDDARMARLHARRCSSHS